MLKRKFFIFVAQNDKKLSKKINFFPKRTRSFVVNFRSHPECVVQETKY